MLHFTRAISVITFGTAIILANVACRQSYRSTACDEIEAASRALQGDKAAVAVATLQKHARSDDAFVRTQAVMVAGRVGPELDEPFRSHCMNLVGHALNDQSGYVLHQAISDIGEYGEPAKEYIDTLLAISSTSPHLSNGTFALESLGRIGVGRSDVGDRLVKAITEQYPVAGGEAFPYRFQALSALESWGDKACPWLSRLRSIRDSLQAQQGNEPQAPAAGLNGPALWAKQRAENQFEMLKGLIGNLEKVCEKEKGDLQEAAK